MMLPRTLDKLSLEQQVDAIFEAAPYLDGKIQKHCDLGECSPAQAMLEVLRFLSLINPDAVITPSERVDLVWHQLILSTRVYSEYCTKLYKKYLHHTPSDDMVENTQQFEHCLNLYAQRYGKPHPWFWGSHLLVNTTGGCSGCETN